MNWYEFLPKLLNMSMTASLIIVAVLVVRLFLKKAPKVFSYALWAVVLFRLLCPVSVASDFSLLGVFQVPVAQNGALEYIPVDIVHMENPQVTLPALDISMGKKVSENQPVGLSVENSQQGEPLQAGELPENAVKGESSGAVSTGERLSFMEKLETTINRHLPKGEEQLAGEPLGFPVTLATYIWGLGVLALVLYNLVQLVRLRRRLQIAEPLEKKIYLVDHLDSPFVMGLMRPRIYLPSGLKERERSYIILHEQYHIRRGDHIVKVLAFAALCIHWFNPFVWLAFLLAAKDMEMSCDEAVIKHMGQDIRAEYAGSLLQFASGKRLIAGAALAFGEGDTKARVKNVMHYRKPAFGPVLAAVAVCVVAGVCLATNPKEEIDLPLPFAKDRAADVVYDVQVGAAYRTSECLYMNGLSSFVPMDGDDGYLYRIEEDALVKIHRESGKETRVEIEEWGWKEFPYTDEEWAALYIPRRDSQIKISQYFTEMLYQPISGNDCLLKMDGQLWLVEIHNNYRMGNYLWSIYSLIPMEKEDSLAVEKEPDR